MINEALYSSRTDEWETPQEFFDKLDEEFHFGIDVCANDRNAKCEWYFDKSANGLTKDWTGHGTVWCNPPYGKEIGKWVRKASETAEEGETVVMLIPARTDTRWFHGYVYQQPNVEVRFIKGRLHFSNKGRNPFPTMVVIFHAQD